MTSRRVVTVFMILIVVIAALTVQAATFITPADFFGNRRTDYVLIRGIFSSGPLQWFIADSASASVKSIEWGIRLYDTPVVGDFDGDGITDIAVARQATGAMGLYIIPSTTGIPYFEPYGVSGSLVGIMGDYDGDGRTDIAGMECTANGCIWQYKSSLTGAVVSNFWGMPLDDPFPADYDGDGRTDFAVRRAVGGDTQWFIKTATGATSSQYFGLASDWAVPGDYDGDGKADVAVVRLTGGVLIWFVKQSSDGQIVATEWGKSGDLIAPGDYDGDGVADFGVYRVSGRFYVKTALTGNVLTRTWGVSPDYPLTGLAVR